MTDKSYDLKPEDSARVAEIREALIAEMQQSAETSEAQKAVQDIVELKGDALAALKHTIRHSMNETLKARVSMWAIDTIIEAERNSDDPMVEFLGGLRASAPTPANQS
jgi:hypothetical protein